MVASQLTNVLATEPLTIYPSRLLNGSTKAAIGLVPRQVIPALLAAIPAVSIITPNIGLTRGLSPKGPRVQTGVDTVTSRVYTRSPTT